MEIRRDPVTQSWVVSGQRERPEDGEGGCPFDPPAIDSAKTILSWPSDGQWQIRVLPHPEPLYRVENDPGRAAEGIYDKMGPLGAHEVVVETPQHDKRFSSFSDEELDHVLGVWGSRIADLKKDARFKYVTVFKNEGPQAGQEWTHAHSQITATIFVPGVSSPGSRDQTSVPRNHSRVGPPVCRHDGGTAPEPPHAGAGFSDVTSSCGQAAGLRQSSVRAARLGGGSNTVPAARCPKERGWRVRGR